jgi:uncharacterized integral membrane protein
MAFLEHNGESEFPLPKELVYSAMCRAIPTIKGMKIKSADKLQGRIMVKAGVSLFSWGENIPIQLISVNENLTKVQITSSPKTGIMFGGAFDMGKNRKNIESILSATSQILSSESSIQEKSENSVNKSNNVQSNQNLNFMENQVKKQKPFYKKTWVIVVGIIIFIIIIVNIGGNDKSSTTSTSTDTETVTSTATETSKAKQWTVVYEFKGNGTKKSPAFELTGNSAKLKYNYQGENGLGIGMFAVYVVEEGKDILVEGGIPEVMTTENEESESSIQKGAGRYYLDVQASGRWTVTVEEEK